MWVSSGQINIKLETFDAKIAAYYFMFKHILEIVLKMKRYHLGSNTRNFYKYHVQLDIFGQQNRKELEREGLQ